MRFEFLSPLHKASRQIATHLEGPAAAQGLSTREAHLLSYLRSYEPCPIGDLNRVFGHRPSTLTSMLDRLGRQGLVRRDPGKEDRRHVILSLTAKGRDTADRVRRCLISFEARVRAHADPRDIQGFHAVMDAIARAAGAPASAPADAKAGKESSR
jgi:MarR family transcriptional regulator, organic hydroperoxide resistance regulator